MWVIDQFYVGDFPRLGHTHHLISIDTVTKVAFVNLFMDEKKESPPYHSYNYYRIETRKCVGILVNSCIKIGSMEPKRSSMQWPIARRMVEDFHKMLSSECYSKFAISTISTPHMLQKHLNRWMIKYNSCHTSISQRAPMDSLSKIANSHNVVTL